MLLVLVSDTEGLSALKRPAKRLLALRDVQRTRASELSRENQERLIKDMRGAESDVADSVVQTWRYLALWRGTESSELTHMPSKSSPWRP